jgi:hypothetical protein
LLHHQVLCVALLDTGSSIPLAFRTHAVPKRQHMVGIHAVCMCTHTSVQVPEALERAGPWPLRAAMLLASVLISAALSTSSLIVRRPRPVSAHSTTDIASRKLQSHESSVCMAAGGQHANICICVAVRGLCCGAVLPVGGGASQSLHSRVSAVVSASGTYALEA